MGRRRYTEQQFRDAVADPTVTTIAELCRRLGIVPRGGNYTSVRVFGRDLDIDVDAVLGARVTAPRPSARKRPWTPTELERALSRDDVTSIRQLCHALGVAPRTEAYRRIRRVASDLGLDLSGLAPPPKGRPPVGLGVPDDQLREHILRSATRDQVLAGLGLPPTRVNRRRLSRTVARLGLSTEGLARPSPNPPPPGRGGRRRRPLHEILLAGTDVKTSALRRRLVEEGVLPRRCSRCGQTRWQGRPIPLELDHVDGDRRNNRIDNLRLLCPNCHALTPTYRGRNIGRRAGSGD